MAIEKGALKGLGVTLLIVESYTLPIFRSGGRTGLSFWGWVKNHSIWGPPVEYVPEEDYMAEILPTGMGTNASTFHLAAGPKVATGKDLLRQYVDLKANVRGTGDHQPIRELIQPNDPEVREIAAVLHQADDFVGASQDFVDSFTTYRMEIDDYWETPRETLEGQAADCDGKAILLCSILRNYIPAEEVYCAFGTWRQNGKAGGHMWVVMDGVVDRIIEATAHSGQEVKGYYNLEAIFNDKYAFVYPQAIKDFDLIPVNELVSA